MKIERIRDGKKNQYVRPEIIILKLISDGMMNTASVSSNNNNDGIFEVKKVFFEEEESDKVLHRRGYWDMYGTE